jgi:hypothetical protein
MNNVALETNLLKLDQKIKLVATDIYDAVLITGNSGLDDYRPSKQLAQLLSKDEYVNIIKHLHSKRLITFPFENIILSTNSDEMPTYNFSVSFNKLKKSLGIQPSAPVVPFTFDKVAEALYIKGHTISVRPGTLRYYTVEKCVGKPGKAIQETDIMAKYRPDYEVYARKRAIRDAVIALNKRVKAVTGIEKLFIYSNGHVTFDAKIIQS